MKQEYYMLYNEDTGEYGLLEEYSGANLGVEIATRPVILIEEETRSIVRGRVDMGGFKLRKVRLEILPEE